MARRAADLAHRPAARSSRLDLAFVTRTAHPRPGGIEAHLHRVGRTLAEEGHRIRIWTARIDDRPLTRTNTTILAQRFAPFFEGAVETLPVPIDGAARARLLPLALNAMPGIDRISYHGVRRATLPAFVSAVSPRLRRAFSSAQLVHAYGGEQLAYAAAIAAREKGIPYVITPFAHPGHWGDDELNLELYRAADRVIALLAGEAAFYASRGVSRDRIRVLGVAAPPAGTPAVDVRARYGIDGPLVLCLGVKRAYKYRTLLEAVPLLRDPALRVAFVGPHMPESERDFASPDPRVVAVGKVDEGEKWGWLAAADVLCLPSASEILPVSVLEAWRMGTAVVVAEGSYTRDLIDDGRDGIICARQGESVAAALETLLADPDRARAMGAAGRAKVAERYEPAMVAGAHEEIYASLIGAQR